MMTCPIGDRVPCANTDCVSALYAAGRPALCGPPQLAGSTAARAVTSKRRQVRARIALRRGCDLLEALERAAGSDARTLIGNRRRTAGLLHRVQRLLDLFDR